MKKGVVTGVPYFNCMLQMEKNARKTVCFSPNKRRTMGQASESEVPVKITKFNINKGDVMLNDRSQIKLANPSEVSFQFNKHLASEATVTLIELVKFVSGQLINTKAHVSEVYQVRPHRIKDGSVDSQEVLLTDTTTSIKLKLFGEDVGMLQQGKSYILKNLRLHIVKTCCYLNTTLSEKFEAKEIPDIESLVEVTEESISRVRITCKVIGVKTIASKALCLTCNRSCVDLLDETMVKCVTCNLTLRKAACNMSWYANLLVTDIALNENHNIFFRNDYVHQLSDIAGFQLTSEDELAKEMLSFRDPLVVNFDVISKEVVELHAI